MRALETGRRASYHAKNGDLSLGGMPSIRHSKEAQFTALGLSLLLKIALSLDDIQHLFERHGAMAYSGEPVSQLQHALQSASLAEEAGASPELITAALLHDLGHLMNLQGETPTQRGIDDLHQ